VPIETFVVH